MNKKYFILYGVMAVLSICLSSPAWSSSSSPTRKDCVEGSAPVAAGCWVYVSSITTDAVGKVFIEENCYKLAYKPAVDSHLVDVPNDSNPDESLCDTTVDIATDTTCTTALKGTTGGGTTLHATCDDIINTITYKICC